MRIAELWRFPVKSLAGEAVERVEVGAEGIPGDRGLRVVDARGRLVTARTRPALLGLHATLGDDGEALVDGVPWTEPAVARAIEEAAGPGARLERCAPGEGFDDTPLLVATDGAIEWSGVDRRRFRANVLVSGVEGLAEREWPGRRLHAGTAVIELPALRVRCVVTTFDPDTLEQDPEVLARINRELDGTLALDALVAEPGAIAVGDPVEVR